MSDPSNPNTFPPVTKQLSEATPTLPSWRCHKVVVADRVKAQIFDGDNQLWLLDSGVKVQVSPAMAMRCSYSDHASEGPVGGYFVRYEDGYESWSPADAFEKGYTKITITEQADPIAHAIALAGQVAAAEYEKRWPPGEQYAKVKYICVQLCLRDGLDPNQPVVPYMGQDAVRGPNECWPTHGITLVPLWGTYVETVAPIVDIIDWVQPIVDDLNAQAQATKGPGDAA